MRLPLFALVSLCLTTTATAIEDLRVPGGVAVIPIESEARPTFNGKPVLTFRDNGQHVAVVGLSLSLEPLDTESAKLLSMIPKSLSFLLKL